MFIVITWQYSARQTGNSVYYALSVLCSYLEQQQHQSVLMWASEFDNQYIGQNQPSLKSKMYANTLQGV